MTDDPTHATGFWGLPRVYWTLWLTVLVNRMATFVYPFLVLYLTRERGMTVVTAGAVATVMGVGAVVGTMAGGTLADRAGRRFTLLLGYFGSSVALLGLAAARGTVLIVVAAFVTGIASEIARPAASALTADVVPPGARTKAYSLTFWALNLGFSVATFSAGLLSRWGWTVLFVVQAAAAFLAGMLLWTALPRNLTHAKHTAEGGGLLRLLAASGPLRILTCAGVAYALVYQQAYATLPLVMAHDGLPPEVYGQVIAVNGLVIVVVQPLASAYLDRFRAVSIYGLSLGVVGAGFAATALADTVSGHIMVVIAWSLGEVGVAAVVSVLFADLAPAHARGRVMALLGATFSAGIVVGPLLGTSVLDAVGESWLWAVAGVTLALTGALVAATLRVDRTGSDTEPAIPAGAAAERAQDAPPAKTSGAGR